MNIAYATTKCNATHSCPEKTPCCSQYGVCGTGSLCLGGCDPRYSYNLTACMPAPRMSDLSTVFDTTDVLMKQEDYLGNYTETDWVYTGDLTTHKDAILMQMKKHSSGTVISSTQYLWYGKITTTMKSSRGRGVITAFILFSDVQDEIDTEFIGYNLTAYQSNYYALGITDYNNSIWHDTTDTFENYHTYEVDWQEDKLEWSIDGKHLRTLKKEDTWNSTTKRYDYPQTPSRIQFSLWPGGDSANAPGTIEWAGGPIDWDSEDIKKPGYYYAYIKNITVEAYDLPFAVELDDSDEDEDDESKFHAFLYNSTKGNETDIYLTTKKTWLGSKDATGIDPDNDSDDEDETTTIVSGSGSKKATKVSTKAHKTASSSSSDDSYNTKGSIGGFVQSSKSQSSTSSSEAFINYPLKGIIGALFALIAATISFVI